MLRSIAIRNESILRGSLSRAAKNRAVLRVFSTEAVKKHRIFRLSGFELNKPKQATVWSTNFVRAYSSLPNHTKVLLPALSPTMEQGTIVSWVKKEGDKLNEGDLLAEIETDKATMGFETPEEGYLAKILIKAGTKDVPIGKLVCIIVDEQADVAAFNDYKDDAPSSPPPKKAEAPPAPAAAPVAAPPPPTPPQQPVAASAPASLPEKSGKGVYASPMAKRLAEAQQLRLQGKGSGIYGSIKSGDLAGMAAGAPAAAGPKIGTAAGPGAYIDIPVSNIRAVIAKRLQESKQQIPHYYLTVECNVDKLLKFRESLNKKLEKQKIKLSVNDFIIKATATACSKVPESNSYWMGNVIRQFSNVDVSVAVSTDRGLITPIVFGADRKGVIDINQEIKVLAAKARENKLQPNEFQGGTVCVSNLGMFGIDSFMAVINPPQSLILAVGATKKKLIADAKQENSVKEINVLNVTISADHRTIDGAVGAQWLQKFRDYMEDPANMIL